MHNIGVLQRRGLKRQLTQHPPIPGELVYAVDTDEFGVLIDGVLTWRKLFGIKGGADSSIGEVTSVNGQVGDVILDKTDIDLGNVDNTSDLDKPISTATQDALDQKLDISNAYTSLEIDNLLNSKVGTSYTYSKQESLSIFEQIANKGVINGYAELDKNGKVPTSQIYNSDDIAEFSTYKDFPVEGADNRIYIDKNTNTIYRYDVSNNTYNNLGTSLYDRTNPTQISVGGVNIGTTFKGTVTDALDKILYPYVEPQILTFTTTIPTPVQVGQTIKSNTYNISYSFTKIENIDTVEVIFDGKKIATIDPSTTTTSININDTVLNQYGSKSLLLKVTSKNNITTTKEILIKWLHKIYYGEGPENISSIEDITNLRSTISETFYGIYKMQPYNYKWICIPVDYSALTENDRFTLNNIEIPVEDYIVVQKTDYITTSYYCYKTTNSIGNYINIVLLNNKERYGVDINNVFV